MRLVRVKSLLRTQWTSIEVNKLITASKKGSKVITCDEIIEGRVLLLTLNTTSLYILEFQVICVYIVIHVRTSTYFGMIKASFSSVPLIESEIHF